MGDGSELGEGKGGFPSLGRSARVKETNQTTDSAEAEEELASPVCPRLAAMRPGRSRRTGPRARGRCSRTGFFSDGGKMGDGIAAVWALGATGRGEACGWW